LTEAHTVSTVAATRPAEAAPRVVYGIDDRPPLKEAIPLGFQHLVAMLLGNITPPLLITGALGLATGDIAFVLQMVLVMAGLATLVQAYPIGPVGGRIPVIMGTSIAFVGGAIAIGRQHGLAVVFGACLAGCLVEIVLGFSIVRLRWLFPPLVNGIVVMLIGLTLIPVGMDYAAGGVHAEDYGSLANLGVAAVVFLITLLLNQFGRGFVSYASMLIGVTVGYAAAFTLGKVDLTHVADAAWFALPRPLAYGLEFQWTAILVMGFIYVISTMETIGDITATLAAVGREPTDDELRGGLVADGVMSGLAALFSAFPNTSYSQNVGLVNFTGVVSRHVTAIGGIILVALGVVPKVGALFATIPPAVIGGGGLIMFAMIFASGLSIIHRSVPLTRRNLVILAVATGLGLGVELRPDALQHLPEGLRTFFGSGLIAGGLTALVLNLVLLERQGSDPVGKPDRHADGG
jgi:NCS2 family nucleobase:cation symporter-2